MILFSTLIRSSCVIRWSLVIFALFFTGNFTTGCSCKQRNTDIEGELSKIEQKSAPQPVSRTKLDDDNTSIGSQQPEFSLDVHSLVSERQTNLQETDRKYRNRIVEVEGVIKKHRQERESGLGIVNLTSHPENTIDQITCFYPIENDPIVELEVGSHTSLVCRYPNSFGDKPSSSFTLLLGCRFSKTPDDFRREKILSTSKPVSAESLIVENIENEFSLRARYRDSDPLVHGKVLKLNVNIDNPFSKDRMDIYFDVGPLRKRIVSCTLPVNLANIHRISHVSSGNHLTVTGTLRIVSRYWVAIDECFIVEPYLPPERYDFAPLEMQRIEEILGSKSTEKECPYPFIEVSGILKDFGQVGNKVHVEIGSSQNDKPVVHCVVKAVDSVFDRLASLKRNYPIVVQGRCGLTSSELIIRDCNVL